MRASAHVAEVYRHVSPHHCGADLLFVRDADGRSREMCSCGWYYDFAQANNGAPIGPLTMRPAR